MDICEQIIFTKHKNAYMIPSAENADNKILIVSVSKIIIFYRWIANYDCISYIIYMTEPLQYGSEKFTMRYDFNSNLVYITDPDYQMIYLPTSFKGYMVKSISETIENVINDNDNLPELFYIAI